jgi:hypothetical protein
MTLCSLSLLSVRLGNISRSGEEFTLFGMMSGVRVFAGLECILLLGDAEFRR